MFILPLHKLLSFCLTRLFSQWKMLFLRKLLFSSSTRSTGISRYWNWKLVRLFFLFINWGKFFNEIHYGFGWKVLTDSIYVQSTMETYAKVILGPCGKYKLENEIFAGEKWMMIPFRAKGLEDQADWVGGLSKARTSEAKALVIIKKKKSWNFQTANNWNRSQTFHFHDVQI